LTDSLSRVLCKECENKLEFIGDHYCKKCGMSLSDGFSGDQTRCPACNRFHLVFNRVVALGRYVENFRELILQLKFRRKNYLVRYLGRLLAERLKSESFIKHVDLILPVPMKKWKVISRGYNQSELLAKEVSKHLGIRYVRNCLVKTKSTQPQSSLAGYQRLQNVKDAFRVKHSNLVKDKVILVVDDVYTTGSTVNECTGVLLASGARDVYVAVVARS
jgi:ComF family protein